MVVSSRLMVTLVFTCAGLKLASPAKPTVRGTEPGAGAAAMFTVATPLPFVVAWNVLPANTKLKARPFSGFPVPSVNCAARTSGSLNSPVFCPAYNNTGMLGGRGWVCGGHGPEDIHVLVTCSD